MEDDVYARGRVLAAQHRIADWFASFMAFARERDATSAWRPQLNPVPPHKLRHDSEQRAYQQQAGIAAGLGLHIEGGARLNGPAVNPANSTDAARQWHGAAPQIAVIDDFLTPAALDALRRHCWGSDVWQQSFADGYVGAFPEHGFAAPLLAQIAEELRSVFGEICGDHPLKYVWAFKYDSELRGIGVHADEAAVNVNFWITPDEANLDPESGGLVIWDKAAPLDWDFSRYNSDVAAIRDFLEQSGARKRVVPYRANRAVIFDSDLFHQTDNIHFRPGYLNRRINVTMLYGDRHTGTTGSEDRAGAL
ncbi:MAG TPA: hypothetical protein VHZ32_13055 [Rhizomicrobium sp.]|nr:hypothetical protein [Rhizomicrobium sp.]